MPLCVNVGLNRKASADFQSRGCSINITAELDAALLTRPQELQGAIDNLYDQARLALDRQCADEPGTAPCAWVPSERASPPQNEYRSRNGHGYGNGQGGNGSVGAADGGLRPMTPRQRSAILGLARRADMDAVASARRTFGIGLDELSTRQASQLIDSLKR